MGWKVGSGLPMFCDEEKGKKKKCIYRFEVLGIRLADSFEWGGASVWGGSG